MRLANFTTHDQKEHIFKWNQFGFKIDPKPRAPLINYETKDWTEEAILEAVIDELTQLRYEGFEAILIRRF
ncbi:MAG: hypothetical protein C4554_01235 [Dethiobacter sp.]|jgi:hypothetical protein|nr:MAG: hypothetical protein C4554_01235 [Dethiobacter sp.]